MHKAINYHNTDDPVQRRVNGSFAFLRHIPHDLDKDMGGSQKFQLLDKRSNCHDPDDLNDYVPSVY